MEISGKVYYDLATGNVILHIGSSSGDVRETTREEDFSSFVVLSERVMETVGCLKYDYGQYDADFAACNGYRVVESGETSMLLFSYPDPSNPESPPVYRKPLSEEAELLMNADLDNKEAIVTLYEMILMGV